MWSGTIHVEGTSFCIFKWQVALDAVMQLIKMDVIPRENMQVKIQSFKFGSLCAVEMNLF